MSTNVKLHVLSGSCRLLWNGEVMSAIKPTRRLRQGDPLAIYLFVLSMERLGHWIQRRVEESRWKALKASRQGPRISHLFFADDLLLFSEASEDQIACIKEGLERFCKTSGQKVNFNKSLGQKVNFNKLLMFVSPNIPKQVAKRLSENILFP